MYNPITTYRIQFNKDFTFKDFEHCLQYLVLLGVRSIYASPVFKAVPGSSHGYDVTDPNRINPEIGDEDRFNQLILQLKEKNIGWIQDIVPNHMALHMENPWIMDVLKKGRNSVYAPYFDIDFSHPDFRGKLMIPFLGKPLKQSIHEKEIRLGYKDGHPVVLYYDYSFPLKEQTAGELSKNEFSGEEIPEKINIDPSQLEKLLNEQHYRLVPWQEASQHLNYRRFFTINGLISMAMEGDEVFKEYHALITRMVNEKKIQGLRIDHIDGLKEPGLYLEKLRALTGEQTYIVVEKILQNNEQVESDWPIEGTSGYDFLGMVNNLFTYQKNYPQLRRFYQEFTGITDQPEEIIYKKKKMILLTYKNGDLENLVRFFRENFSSEVDFKLQMEDIKNAVTEFLVYFPKYKSYSWFFPLSLEDRNIVESVIRQAETRFPSLKKSLGVLHNLFISQQNLTEEQKKAALQFYLRCMQYTGSLMAKGVEDTTMYDYHCFIAHNEVGDAVNASGISGQEFHQRMLRRQKSMPYTQNTTSTHDTKRGEDVRARLNVLSEFPEEWISLVKQWNRLNHLFKTSLKGKRVPSENEEYFIYQTLIGIFPFDDWIDTQFHARLEAYLIKSLREAKIHTNWNEPNPEYENAVLTFTGKILESGSGFLALFIPFKRKIAKWGICNSLSQLVLKATCPGVPDFYQGTELWDFSLVDPDNRRAVDYQSRTEVLNRLINLKKQDSNELNKELSLNPENGNLKLWFTRLLMTERSLHPNLFTLGQYLPLNVIGNFKEHVFAFARVYKNTWFIVIIPLYPGLLSKNQKKSEIDWEDTAIQIPDLAPEKWTSVQEGTLIFSKGELMLSSILEKPFPFILKGTKENFGRKAGILLPVSSLPGKFGTGDLGAEASLFIDFLWKSGQSFWQVLPVNPVEENHDYSPYHLLSTFAGNLLFINPDRLVQSRLIKEDTLKKYNFQETNYSEFKKAEQFRVLFLDEAYHNFKLHPRPYLQRRFKEFCQMHKFWIEDYTLYLSLRKYFKGQPWNEWPTEFRERDKMALKHYNRENESELEKYKFWQFLFDQQWKTFKNEVNNHGIKLIGDLPFYVNYDSAEVWQHPELFKLSKKKDMLGVAGVPPDETSKNGQLLNVPVYKWEHMKRDNFTWWRNRIQRNLEFFDLVKFTYFQGFSTFWEVPVSEQSAVNGNWKSSSGYELFKKLHLEYPSVPFIAEDLGEWDESVYQMRDTFQIPGMVVLQYAFNPGMQKSVHIPFNHRKNNFVYTGTQDTNTLKGWYKEELTKEEKLMINDYLNKEIKIGSLHLDFIRMCYNSVGSVAILPMQDILGLGTETRLNNPGISKGNWRWKLKLKNLQPENLIQLRNLAILYGRV